MVLKYLYDMVFEDNSLCFSSGPVLNVQRRNQVARPAPYHSIEDLEGNAGYEA